jgi:CHASE3 domain sensor protein
VKYIQFQVQRVAVIIYMACILLLLPAMAVLWSGSFSAGKAWVDHTYATIAAIHAVETTVLNAETGQRGYVITGGDPAYLEPHAKAIENINKNLQLIRVLVRDNPIQIANYNALTKEVALKLDIIQEAIELMDTRGQAEACQVTIKRHGKQAMDAVSNRIAKMIGVEQKLIGERIFSVNRAAFTLSLLLMVIVIRDLFVFIFFVCMTLNERWHRRRVTLV